MVANDDPFLRLESLIDHIECSIAPQLKNALHGDFKSAAILMRAELKKGRSQLSELEQRSRRLAEAQADAIVNSAEIIDELEETKNRLKESFRSEEQARLAAERLSSYGRILDSSDNEIYIFDARTMRFLHVNHGARANLGYTIDDLRQMSPLAIKPEFTEESFAKLLDPLRKGVVSGIRFTATHMRKDGSRYPVEVNMQKSVFEQKSVLVAVVLDISERRKMEDELRGSQEKAIAADRSKSEFLANMSHEIRTPMTAILGFSEALLDQSISAEEKIQAIQTIHRNGQHLLELINDILDLSKVEAGKLEVEQRSVSPSDILQDVKQLLGERARERGNSLQIELQGSIPQTIQTDPTRLKQALVNLAGNAVKFTTNGVVQIVAGCDFEKQQMFFRVIDNGIGISPEQMKRIFKPFSQADSSTTREHGGTGLGLAITERIAELLGGAVRVQSEPGKGSAFTLTLATGPLNSAPTISRLDSPAFVETSPRELRRGGSDTIEGRVLLVEDGLDNQRLLAFVLKKAGAEVCLAENGKKGVEAALAAWKKGTPFGLILMDMQMPVMDGYAATAHLRNAGYSGQIVALTAHAMKGEIDKCLAAGCDAYLTKPIDANTFIPEVASRIGLPSEYTATPILCF